MTKRIDQFVSENSEGINRLDSTFITISGQSNRSLSFTNNFFEIETSIEVYTRPIDDTDNSLISGHPNGSVHGSGNGTSGDNRGDWTLEEDATVSEQFTVGGRDIVSDALTGSDSTFIGEVAVGSDGTDAQPTDGSLYAENGRSFAWPLPGSNSNQSEAHSILLFSDRGGSIAEYASYARNGKMYNRMTTSNITPSNNEEVKVVIEYTVTGSSTGESLATYNGEDQIAKTFRAIDVVTGMAKIAFGTGTSELSKSDTSLNSQVYESNIKREASNESVTGQTILFNNVPSTQPVTLSEIAVLDPNGDAIWLSTFDPVEKTDTFEIKTSVQLRIQ